MMMAFEFVRSVESNDIATGVLSVYLTIVGNNGQTLGHPRDVGLGKTYSSSPLHVL